MDKYAPVSVFFRWTKLTVHKDMYRGARLKLNSLTANSKLSCYDEKILHGCPNQKTLFTFLDKVGHRKQVVLTDMPADLLVKSFNDYFIQKITRNRNYLNEQVFTFRQNFQN